MSTKSNKSSILNALKQVALAGPANEQQRQLASRVSSSYVHAAHTHARKTVRCRKSNQARRAISSFSFVTIACNSVPSTSSFPVRTSSRNCTASGRTSSRKSWSKDGSSKRDSNANECRHRSSTKLHFQIQLKQQELHEHSHSTLLHSMRCHHYPQRFLAEKNASSHEQATLDEMPLRVLFIVNCT